MLSKHRFMLPVKIISTDWTNIATSHQTLIIVLSPSNGHVNSPCSHLPSDNHLDDAHLMIHVSISVTRFSTLKKITPISRLTLTTTTTRQSLSPLLPCCTQTVHRTFRQRIISFSEMLHLSHLPSIMCRSFLRSLVGDHSEDLRNPTHNRSPILVLYVAVKVRVAHRPDCVMFMAAAAAHQHERRRRRRRLHRCCRPKRDVMHVIQK